MKKYLIIIASFLLVACSRGSNAETFVQDENVVPPSVMITLEEEEENEPEEEILSPHHDMAISHLTGHYISIDAYNRRPFAVVFNNETRALPQSGLMQADIIYEVLAEGATTRIVAIFQSTEAERIGPIRSTRHYFSDFAMNHDAVLIHHGGSPQAYTSIRNLGLDHVDGMRYDGTVFWRDPVRRAERGLENSSYTSTENILAHAEDADIRLDISEEFAMFSFFEEPTTPSGAEASTFISVPFVASNVAEFRFCEDTNLYYKYKFGNPQLDEETGEQLSVTNILVQITTITGIPGDTEGRRNVTLVGSGEGYLITNGSHIPIRWEKESREAPTQWFFEDGSPLTINIGRTWICVTSNNPTFE